MDMVPLPAAAAAAATAEAKLAVAAAEAASPPCARWFSRAARLREPGSGLGPGGVAVC